MPRRVRNFRIDARIDGRRYPLEGGPKDRDGGFDLTIYQRDGGQELIGARITGRAFTNAEGRLVLAIETEGGQLFHRTER